MTQPPITQDFRLKRRGYQVVQGLIFLVFSASCAYQSVLRYDMAVEKFWNSWWFFALLSLPLLYFSLEAFYKVFVARLVFTPDELILYDFPRARRIAWKDVQRVGEATFSVKKKDFGFLLHDSALEKDGLLAVPIVSLMPFLTSWNDSPIMGWLKHHKPSPL
ncbi:MAG: hypothetical protein FJZ96_06020 [Chloroflexi bacterium]|nr:hypothetical protein [Chloroflexota bacterium]